MLYGVLCSFCMWETKLDELSFGACLYLGDHKRAHTHTHIDYGLSVFYAFYAFPFPTIIKVHMIKVTSLWTRSLYHIMLTITTSLIGYLRRAAIVFLLSLLSLSVVHLSCSLLPLNAEATSEEKREMGRGRDRDR